MAEREGFEPSVRLPLRLFSKEVLSTAQPPLRLLARECSITVERGRQPPRCIFLRWLAAGGDPEHVAAMNRALIWIIAALLALGLSSCALFRMKEKKDVKKDEKSQSKLVGRIASISADKKFVTIQSYGSWQVPAGSVLTTLGADQRASNLRSSGEKLGQFAAADIQAGLPLTGDAVFYSPAEPTKPGGPAAPTPEGFTPSLNSGTGSSSPFPQLP